MAETLAFQLRDDHGFGNREAGEAQTALYTTLRRFVPDDAASAILDREGEPPWIVSASDTHAYLTEVLGATQEKATVRCRPFRFDSDDCHLHVIIEGSAWRFPTWRISLSRDVQFAIETSPSSRSEARRRAELAARIAVALDWPVPLP